MRTIATKRKLGKVFLVVKWDEKSDIAVRRVYEVRDKGNDALLDVRFGEAIELQPNEMAQLQNVLASMSRRLELG